MDGVPTSNSYLATETNPTRELLGRLLGISVYRLLGEIPWGS